MKETNSSETSDSRKSDYDEKIGQDERAKILSRLRGLTSWVGGMIPENEEIEGHRIPLRNIVYGFVATENPTDEEIEGALSLANVLERKVGELENFVRTGDITKAEGHRLEDEIRGLIKAIDELRHLKGDAMGMRAKAMASKVDDQRRWLDFVNRIK
jgi:hypothetical protein